jgi:hypothetical protein
MFEIDLKKYSPKRKLDNTYLCNVRKRLITATPEEEIRQSIINYLVSEKGYPLQNISIEIPMTHFPKGKGKKGRADIVISDNDENTLCIIECKESNEYLTDNVLDQILKYDEVIDSENLCIAIGNRFWFLMKNGDELLTLTEFPSFKTLMENGQVEYFLEDHIPFEKFTFKEPIPNEEIDLLKENCIIGENTPKHYHSFLINLYNFFIDDEDVLRPFDNIEDIGIKVTKYGNASGGQFFGDYRAFLDLTTKAVISFSLSSITRGEGYPVNTALMIAVDVKGNFHLSLELRVDKYVFINENYAEIIHDGTITIGKQGAAKRSELIDFIRKRQSHLLKNGKVHLGKFDFSKEITSELDETKEFIKRCIDYALIRDKFREMKKGLG